MWLCTVSELPRKPDEISIDINLPSVKLRPHTMVWQGAGGGGGDLVNLLYEHES